MLDIVVGCLLAGPFFTSHHRKWTCIKDLSAVFLPDAIPDATWAQSCSLRITRP